MSIAIMVLGQSGTGKSTSLRNMNPNETLLIQAIKKPLPFRSKWSAITAENPQGNIYQQDNADAICNAMLKTKRDIVVIDDFQYVMSNEFMRRSNEKGYEKFTDIGKNAWNILNTASQLADHKRVYILSHTDTDEFGRVKAKTIGKMLDDKITLEGMFSIVLRSQIINEQYMFSTQNNGNDTCKTPMGMFTESFIENDLAAVDKAVTEYYELKAAA
jgi:predicted ATP-dependent serine protease